MKRKINILKRISALLLTAIFLVTMIPMQNVEAVAVTDSISFGEPSFNAVTNVMKYSSCVGYGSTTYKSLVVTFTSTCVNGEKIVLPTQSGFVNQTTISNDVTKVVNIPSGATLSNIASFIRKIEFQNCAAAAQEIKFSVGKEEVHFMTLYSNDTGHFYQFVPYDSTTIDESVTNGLGQHVDFGTWQYAYYQALNMEYEGLQGYLCTITSAQEDAFLEKNSGEIGWLGATRMAPGTKDVKNGISYYKSFTIPAANAAGAGYWYWATGPELDTNNGKFLSGVTGTMALMATEKSRGNYNNWNKKDLTAGSTAATEPNNSGGTEYCATTLKIGSGFETSGASGSITASSPYYIASGYSWNDVDNNRWAFHDAAYGVEKKVTFGGKTYSTKIDDYRCTGFFVEFGSNTDGEPCYISDNSFLGFVQGTSTNALTHNWEYVQNESKKNEINAYCTTTDPKCSYFGSKTVHANTIDFEMVTPDIPKDGKPYSQVSYVGAEGFTASTGGTIGTVKYYETTVAGQVVNGTELPGAPSDIGYYYAEVTATTGNVGAGTKNNTAKAVSAFKIYDPSGEITEEALNNRIDEELKLTSIITPASDETKLNVVLSSPADEIKLYKIGTCTWTDNSLEEMQWIQPVKDWLGENGAYSTIAKDPKTLSVQGNSVWSSFFNDLLQTEGHMDLAQLTDLVTNPSDQYVNHITSYKNEAGDIITSEASGYSKYMETFEEIELGVYAVVTEGYSVTVISIYPQETGPNNTYYLPNEYTIYLKEIQASIDKTINGLKEDTLAIGEVEHFEIKVNMPTYKDQAFTYENAASLTSSGYRLIFEDIMASGYTIAPDTLKIYYYYTDSYRPDGEASDVHFEQKVLMYSNGGAIPTASPYKFFDAASTNTAVTSKHRVVSDDIGAEYAKLTKEPSLEGAYAHQRTDVPIFDDVAIEPSTSASSNTKITINFDEPALRQYMKEIAHTDAKKVIKGFIIAYDAQVNPYIKIASEENTNTAYIHYEKSSVDKTLIDMHDTVYGYTYASTVIKINGSDSTETDIKYLAGAKFKLFQEVASYSRTGSAGSYEYSYLGDIHKNTEDPFLALTGKSTTTEAIESLKTNSGYYVYEMTAPEGGTKTNAFLVNDALREYVANHSANDTAINDKLPTNEALLSYVEYAKDATVVRVYKQITLEDYSTSQNPVTSMANDSRLGKGVITSVAKASGVTVYGLDTGSYILSEVAAPTGFNELAEDVYFEINKLNQLEEQATTTKTLQQFREMPKVKDYDPENPETAELNVAANLEIKVFNYKGLTLPSTGGMGTLIFTLAGLLIMLVVIAYIIMNKRRNSESFMM